MGPRHQAERHRPRFHEQFGHGAERHSFVTSRAVEPSTVKGSDHKMLLITVKLDRAGRDNLPRGRRWKPSDQDAYWRSLTENAQRHPHASLEVVGRVILETAIVHEAHRHVHTNSFDKSLIQHLSSERNRIVDAGVRRLVAEEIRRIQQKARRRRAVATLRSQLENSASRPLPRSWPGPFLTDPATDLEAGRPDWPHFVRYGSEDVPLRVLRGHPVFEEITAEEVADTIAVLSKKRSSGGSHGVHYSMLKGCTPAIAAWLATAFTEHCRAPANAAERGKTTLVMLPNITNPRYPSEFRPICLIPVLKTLDKIPMRRVEAVLHQKWSPKTLGFRPGHKPRRPTRR